MEIDMNTEVIIGFLFTPVKAFSSLTILKQKNKFFMRQCGTTNDNQVPRMINPNQRDHLLLKKKKQITLYNLF